MLNTETVQSTVRHLITIAVGFGFVKAEENQINQIAAGAAAAVVVLGVLFWGRKSDAKLLKAPPPSN